MRDGDNDVIAIAQGNLTKAQLDLDNLVSE